MSLFARSLVLGLFGISLTVNLFAIATDPGWLVLPAALFGWFLADAASGLVHMTMDYRPCPAGRGLSRLYFYEGSRESSDYLSLLRTTMAPLGPLDRLTYDFKNHHPRPDALGRRSMWRQVGLTISIAALPMSVLLNLAWYWFDLSGATMAMGFALIVGGAFAQYFHGTLHRADNPWIISAMRRTGLLMTPAAHQRHHESLQRDFSTNCGWSNPLINLLFVTARRRGYFGDSGLEPHH